MVKVKINGEERYFDEILLKNLDMLKVYVDKKWDGVVYVGGYEGDGKSEFAGQIALYLDPSYGLSRCVFTPEQFMEAVDKAGPGQAIVYDEAQDVFESTNRDAVSKAVKSKLTRIRKKRLYIIFCAADFWRINKYLFIHRSRAFIRIYERETKRGFFEFYNRERKHDLFIRGKKNEQLVVPPNFRGRFTHWFPLDEEAYDAKKEEATRIVGGKPSFDRRKVRQYFYAGVVGGLDICRDKNWFNSDFKFNKFCQIVGVSDKTIQNARKFGQNDDLLLEILEKNRKKARVFNTNNLPGEQDAEH